MKFTLTVKNSDAPDSAAWRENYDEPKLETSEQVDEWAKATVAQFNETLRPGEKNRVLLATEVHGNGTSVHVWEKQNLVTIHDRAGLYDQMKCLECGVTAKRFGLTKLVRDRAYRAKGYEDCDNAKQLMLRRRSK